jgi:hypothetical protein
VTMRSLPLSVAHRRIREEPAFPIGYLNLLTNELAKQGSLRCLTDDRHWKSLPS